MSQAASFIRQTSPHSRATLRGDSPKVCEEWEYRKNNKASFSLRPIQNTVERRGEERRNKMWPSQPVYRARSASSR